MKDNLVILEYFCFKVFAKIFFSNWKKFLQLVDQHYLPICENFGNVIDTEWEKKISKLCPLTALLEDTSFWLTESTVNVRWITPFWALRITNTMDVSFRRPIIKKLIAR